jgi:ABC-type antimicrobial peptide transport system permease subunit
MEHALSVNLEAATPGYFEAMRIPLIAGRYFDDGDIEAAPAVAVLGETAARDLFPGGGAVGRLIASGGDPRARDGKFPWRTVVGVVKDVRYRGLQDVRRDLYGPHRQTDDKTPHIVIRTSGDPFRLAAHIRREVREMDKAAVVEGMTTMRAIVDRALAPWRLNMVMFAMLGVLAVAMAVVGVYGVVRTAVVDRWQELGIRTALGASAGQVAALVLREGLALILMGFTLGSLAAALLAPLMAAILFGVAPFDATTFAGVSGALIVPALAASYFPARTAGRVNPADLLRS